MRTVEIFVVAAAAVLLSVPSFPAGNRAEAPARVDFSSSPSGAAVSVDGVLRGNAPLTLYDIPDGEHHVRYELKGYEDVDFFMNVERGSRLSLFREMIPLKGLLLVTTDPAGCTLSLDGVSLGETPRLVTSLDATLKYKFRLEKPGYQPRTIAVEFDGRKPVARHEKMTLDSGSVTIVSEPSGAAVTLNGIGRGETPCTVDGIPRGNVSVELSMDGYKTESRSLALKAGERQNLFVEMNPIPGTMSLSSIPDGARFYVDGELRSKGDTMLENVKPGWYTVRAELDDHETEERRVFVPNGGAANVEMRLQSVLGSIEIRTNPANAVVKLDGRIVGTTRPSLRGNKTSEVLAIGGVKAGEHTLEIRRDGFVDKVRKVKVKPSSVSTVRVRLDRAFVPDVEITTNTGVRRGVLVKNGEDEIVLEVSMGITQTFRRSDVIKMTFINMDGGK